MAFRGVRDSGTILGSLEAILGALEGVLEGLGGL
jgi:hypothetical protein